ncbi:uncharacterized protein LOC143628277 [Bidens hawaiensis]|uniref:uncharacterized protein LOC143628277 n=1 Tax=Bidens hawaiensis TaxID=980011 RepID=UPI00404AE52E
MWERRKQGFSIGRIHQVSPSLGEAYFLRILLNKVKGPKSFEDIRMVDGQTFSTFRDACYARGLLDDDMEYIEAFKEAGASALFLDLILCGKKTWEYLSNGIIYTQQRILNIPDLSLPENQIKNLTLCEIEKVFDEIMNLIEANKGGVFFLYGYGGTGKTFLWKILYVAIRSKGQIVLNVSSIGIASLLLSGGRTAHSRFHISINLNEDSTCSIKSGNDDAHLLKEMKLIIWDEVPMIHKHAVEALDRKMVDILTHNTSINSGIPFGGKVIVFVVILDKFFL